MKDKILKLNQILAENFIGNNIQIAYSCIKGNFYIAKKEEKIKENLTAKQAIEYIEFMLDALEIER